ncbi:BgTH12-07812, partial [Blumeria graminis f. sp. triticale]
TGGFVFEAQISAWLVRRSPNKVSQLCLHGRTGFPSLTGACCARRTTFSM